MAWPVRNVLPSTLNLLSAVLCCEELSYSYFWPFSFSSSFRVQNKMQGAFSFLPFSLVQSKIDKEFRVELPLRAFKVLLLNTKLLVLDHQRFTLVTLSTRFFIWSMFLLLLLISYKSLRINRECDFCDGLAPRAGYYLVDTTLFGCLNVGSKLFALSHVG